MGASLVGKSHCDTPVLICTSENKCEHVTKAEKKRVRPPQGRTTYSSISSTWELVSSCVAGYVIAMVGQAKHQQAEL